jgi:hypothetical protein
MVAWCIRLDGCVWELAACYYIANAKECYPRWRSGTRRRNMSQTLSSWILASQLFEDSAHQIIWLREIIHKNSVTYKNVEFGGDHHDSSEMS